MHLLCRLTLLAMVCCAAATEENVRHRTQTVAYLYDFILTWFQNEEARTKLSNRTRPACIFTLFCLYFLLLTTHIISKAVGSLESAYSLTSHLFSHKPFWFVVHVYATRSRLRTSRHRSFELVECRLRVCGTWWTKGMV